MDLCRFNPPLSISGHFTGVMRALGSSPSPVEKIQQPFCSSSGRPYITSMLSINLSM